MAESSGEVKPQPQFEAGKESSEGQEILAERVIEKPSQTEAGQAKQVPQFSPPPLAQAPANAHPQSGGQAKGQTGTKPITSDLGALDSDRIEKQWVERAKSIVAETQDDPYTQKKKMSKVKADYIKKRFDKTIPADDAAIS
jgi:hypothetical protein